MKKLDGKVSSIRELLFGARFGIDYYQREYRWERRQVEELIDDLTSQFGDDHDPSHPRAKVREYRHYFLGAVITSEKEGRRFLIDGQQRYWVGTLGGLSVFDPRIATSSERAVAKPIYLTDLVVEDPAGRVDGALTLRATQPLGLRGSLNGRWVLLFTLPAKPRGRVERSALQQVLAALYNFFFK
jgi:hypothetical protein